MVGAPRAFPCDELPAAKPVVKVAGGEVGGLRDVPINQLRYFFLTCAAAAEVPRFNVAVLHMENRRGSSRLPFVLLVESFRDKIVHVKILKDLLMSL